MSRFEQALLSAEPGAMIPPQDDWFAPLIGDGVFDYGKPNGRRLKGERFFQRVLEGMAIEDIFICRPERQRTKPAARR